jgi:3-deoxy-manno-octulosonate cytidylyltransferase (CMP-KDO synthetase)
MGSLPKVTVVIPARLASTRLPEKPLADIAGKPMIQWVYERARRASGVDRVIVATDHEKVVQAVKAFSGEVVMTPSDLQSGTDRVACTAELIGAGENDILVNLQGDEPLIEPKAIEKAIELVKSKRFPIGTVMVPLKDEEELLDLSVVKVIADQNDRAIYFSRFPIPYSRQQPKSGKAFECMKHVGIYVYDRKTLSKFRSLPVTEIEKTESLEQLRALKNGIPIGITQVNFVSIGVDTPEDLEKVRKVLHG